MTQIAPVRPGAKGKLSMRTPGLTLAVALAVSAATTGVAFACVEGPKVVGSSLPNGATNVDPGLKTLSFTFNHEMARDGWSVVRTVGGQTPEIVGKPAFSKDGRTVTLTVRLKPGQRYDLRLNGGEYWNFRSNHGVSADSYHFGFSTAARAS